MSSRSSQRPHSWSTPLWNLAFLAWVAAAYVWVYYEPVRARELTRASEMEIARFAAMSLDELQQVIAAPPVPGPPDPAALDRAIERGTRAFLDLYVRPSLTAAQAGGYLEIVRPDGLFERLGPDVYAQCQLYLLVHLLMYREEYGLPVEDPLVQDVLQWLLGTFDPEEGRWLWSEEGCLHPKSLMVLAQYGFDQEFERGWQWAMHSDLYVARADDLFSIRRSGHIVQSLGAADLSLSGRLEWEHEAPIPDEENTAKFLYALLESGQSPESEEVERLRRALSHYLASNPLAIGHMNSHHLLGRGWYVLCHTRFRLPPDDGYRASLAVLRAAAAGEWQRNFALKSIPLFRAVMLRALLEAGDESEEIDAMIHGFVEHQDRDGAWRLPHTYGLWGWATPPTEGYKYGNMDGANTYMTALALISYRNAKGR